MAEKAERMEQQQKGNVVKFRRRFAVFTDENDQIAAFVPERKRITKGLGVNWVAFYQDALEWMATENLPNEQYRVLMYLMSKLDFENYLRITQTSIGKALGMKLPNVSRAIRGLLERDILVTGPLAGHSKTYRLNPYVGYKGKDASKAIVEFDELKRRREQGQEQAGED